MHLGILRFLVLEGPDYGQKRWVALPLQQHLMLAAYMQKLRDPLVLADPGMASRPLGQGLKSCKSHVWCAEPQSSGSSRSLSIDDLERRIEALNSTLQLHIDQKTPMSGLQSPAIPASPVQAAVNAPV